MAPSALKSPVALPQTTRTMGRRDDTRDVVMRDETKEGGKRAGSNVPDSKLHVNKAKLSKPHATISPESDKLVHAQRSPLSLTNDPRDVLAKLLRTPTLLTTAEVLASSKELSSLLAEQICYNWPMVRSVVALVWFCGSVASPSSQPSVSYDG